MDVLHLDLQGLKCPLPVLRTRKVLGAMPAGALVTVVCTDPLAAIDIPHLVQQTGDTLIGVDRDAGVLIFRIRRR